MSATLATVADALIEFILSLMQDPEQAQKFNDHPEQTLADAGLSGISAADVCAVAPVVAEYPHVMPSPPHPMPPRPGGNTVVKEIHNITNSLSYIDARSTVIDQSTNQNIWTNGGDVTQTFDQSAVTASGDGSVAAGSGVDITNSQDHSLHVNAGNDANLGSTVTTTHNDGSYNSATNAPTTTNSSTNVNATDSLNNTSTDLAANHSGNTTTTNASSTSTNTNNTSVDHSSDSSASSYTQQDTDHSSAYDSQHLAAPTLDDHPVDDMTH